MKFTGEQTQLVITLQGAEMLWALKRKLVLPRKDIVDLVWTSEFRTSDLLLRIGGSNVPRLLLAGNFRDTTSRETLFLYLRRPQGYTLARTIYDMNVLAITMRNYTYGEVLVSCDPETGASLMNWFSLGRTQQNVS
jgi:hypothetical protein